MPPRRWLLLGAGVEPLRPARETPSGTADKPASPPPDTFFGRVNQLALERLETWVPDVFPTARREHGTGVWRVSSTDLGRNLEEDLSIHPVHGGRDFGTEESRSPIDVLMEHGGARNAASAALWLCEWMGMEPAALGWRSDGEPEAPEPEPSKLRLLSPAECAASERRGYVAKGLIAPRDLLILFGPPGAGKSVIGPHIAYAVARGAPVFGRRTRGGRCSTWPPRTRTGCASG